MCEGASKQSSDLKKYTATGPRAPVLKFVDPPLRTACRRSGLLKSFKLAVTVLVP